jgi:hypothetical protein
MKIKELLKENAQSLNQLDDPKVYQKCLDSWRDYYDYEDRTLREIEDYKYVVDRLIQKGGKVYRVIFANSPEEIRMDDLGVHWTIEESNIDYYIDSLWTHYGNGKKNSYIIVATVGPNNITNRGVDVAGNPEEKEVNIIRPTEATYEAYEYAHKGRGQRVHENMDHSKDDQAVPQLKAALLAQKKKIQSVKDDKDAVYDIIDGMMTSIAKAHSISGQKLHDMWTKKYKEIPDTWVMHQ